MTESQIQSKILRWLAAKGAYCFKTISCNKAGVPDIIAGYKGAMVCIEVKTPKGRLSSLQEIHLMDIIEAGGHAFVARSLDDVKDYFKENLDV